jgi:drug/metabolite transporter (DMT)-like permease
LGETGSGVFHLWATHYIPAAEANLIGYLRPIEVALAAAIGLFTLRRRQVAGLALGLLGAFVLLGGESLALSYRGIGLALLSGVSWALYCVFRLQWPSTNAHVVSPGSPVLRRSGWCRRRSATGCRTRVFAAATANRWP